MDKINYLLEFYGDGAIYRKARSIRSKEIRMSRVPTNNDIAETISLFDDFGIDECDIPDLPTYNALCTWRRDYIKRWMDEHDDK